MVESNELVKKDFNVDRDNIPFHEQRKIFNGLMKKDFLNFRPLLNLTNEINLNRRDKYIALLNLSIYYIWKNIKKSYKNDKFKISAQT